MCGRQGVFDEMMGLTSEVGLGLQVGECVASRRFSVR